MRKLHTKLSVLFLLAAASGLAASTKAAIVYSSATGRVRWIMVPDSDAELTTIKLHAGEAVLIVERASVQTSAGAQAAASSKSGKAPAGDRYVVVPIGGGTNAVEGVVYADPLCGDAIPGKILVQHDTAEPGWTYDGAVFTAPSPAVVVVNAVSK